MSIFNINLYASKLHCRALKEELQLKNMWLIAIIDPLTYQLYWFKYTWSNLWEDPVNISQLDATITILIAFLPLNNTIKSIDIDTSGSLALSLISYFLCLHHYVGHSMIIVTLWSVVIHCLLPRSNTSIRSPSGGNSSKGVRSLCFCLVSMHSCDSLLPCRGFREVKLCLAASILTCCSIISSCSLFRAIKGTKIFFFPVDTSIPMEPCVNDAKCQYIFDRLIVSIYKDNRYICRSKNTLS